MEQGNVRSICPKCGTFFELTFKESFTLGKDDLDSGRIAYKTISKIIKDHICTGCKEKLCTIVNLVTQGETA